jgi:hypothetical protein
MKIFWFLLVILFAGAGVTFAVQRGIIALPDSFVFGKAVQETDITSSLASIDQNVATQIRTWREDGIETPEILGAVTQSVQNIGQASISATVSTTPQSFWDSLRQQGAQAALAQVVGDAQISVNAVSQNVVDEARYQYCLGVVQARQSQ